MFDLIRISNCLAALEKEAKDSDKYQWGSINTALMDSGWSPARIAKVLFALKGKGRGKGDSKTYTWKEINDALSGMGVSPARIARILTKLKGKKARAERLNIFDYYKDLKLERTDKDRKRFQDIMNKAWDKGLRGASYDREVLRATERMARSIRQADKAYRRGLAAENENFHDCARVFFDRSQELLADMKPLK